MKVCPHCAEELPDDAPVCSECHKDPSVLPVWAVAGRSYKPGRQGPGDARQPDGIPALLDRIERLEDATQKRPIPQVVWVSFALSFSPMIWANVAIALNAIRLVGILLVYSWIFLAR